MEQKTFDITIIGTGYVGLTTGACLAESGNNVVCFDLDADKISDLGHGNIPFFEPGLGELVKSNVKLGRLRFTTNVVESVEHGEIQIIAVGTPPGSNGSADMQYVNSAARNIGMHASGHKIVINKSTVPVGTAKNVKSIILEEYSNRGLALEVSVVSNPEFLREGSAIGDFLEPDRVIVGTDNLKVVNVLREIYGPMLNSQDQFLVMDVLSAELAKYAANAMLATRISFINELSVVAEKLGANIDQIRKGIGSDPRIGSHFLNPGLGYGGSCLPKDVRALIQIASDVDVKTHLLSAVERVNDSQKTVLISKIVNVYGEDLSNKTFAFWGLSFKPNTDDMREAPSKLLITELVERGANLRVYDPEAMEVAKKMIGHRREIYYGESALDVLNSSDALVIATEWLEFREIDLERIKEAMLAPVIFDGRNMYDCEILRDAGFDYFSIGR